MNHTHRQRCLGGAPSLLLALLVASPITPHAGNAQDLPPKGPRTNVPRKLSLSRAFELALRQNRDIRVATLSAERAETRVRAEEGAFDTGLFMQASRERTDPPVAGVPLQNGDATTADARAGVAKRFTTGTDLALSIAAEYDRDRTGAADLIPQSRTGLALTVTQDLLRNATRETNNTGIVIARNTWRISRQDLRSAVNQRLFDVERAYWDLFFAMADLRVREQQQDRAERLVQRAETQVDVGEAAPIEITRAKSSAAAQAVAILGATNRVARIRIRLLRLMGALDVESSGIPLEPADAPRLDVVRTSLEECLQAARESHPEIARGVLDIDNALLTERYTRDQRLPELKLVGGVQLDGLDDDFSGGLSALRGGDCASWELGLRLDVPLPNRTARANYRAAMLEQRRARVRLEATEERILAEVADALEDLRTTEGRIETATDALKLATGLLTAEEKSFALGRSDSLDVLNAQASLATAQRDEVRARTDYATALANLLRAQGNLLEARNITWEE